jgi:biotin synthase
MYELYPGKACVQETAESCAACLRQRILAIGRTVATGRGDARRRDARESPHAEWSGAAPMSETKR